MRSAYRLLLVPLLMLAATLLATGYAVWHARHTTENNFADRIFTIRNTIDGPPTFRLTLAVLEQMKSLTGADFLVAGSSERIRTDDNLQTFPRFSHQTSVREAFRLETGSGVYLGYQFPLKNGHPNIGDTVYVFFPESIRDTEVTNAVRPVLWLGLGGGLLATLLSGYVAFRYAKAEQRRVFGQISDGLAHQLRNAATGAKLALQVAVTGDEVDRESLGVAERQLERVERILKQFLDQNFHSPLIWQSIDLGTIIDTVVQLELPRARHAGTVLTWDRPPLDVRQSIDVAQWTHMVSNLLANAIDAAGSGGTVTLALTTESFTVTDTGPGPSPEIAAKLFEPFVTGKPGGIGLGLMVARQVADAHVHRLDWRRADGRTHFTVTFKRP